MANPAAANFRLRQPHLISDKAGLSEGRRPGPAPGDGSTKNMGNYSPPGTMWCHQPGGIWVFPMNKLQMAPPVGGGLEPRFHVRPARSGRPPIPWTWAIYDRDRVAPCQVSALFYRSAEEAWEAGCAALHRVGKATD
jgi:hypothetical protein